MSSNAPPASVTRAAFKSKPKQNEDLLQRVRSAASNLRDLEYEKKDLEQKLSELSQKILKIYRDDLPSLMDEAGVDSIGIPAQGNLPASDAKMVPYYSASIAASWPEERKLAAFLLLEKMGHGDLIKTNLEVAFPRGHVKKARELADQIKKKGYQPTVKETVNSQTLSAWLREQCEAGKMPQPRQLEILGASVGRVVKLKDRNDT